MRAVAAAAILLCLAGCTTVSQSPSPEVLAEWDRTNTTFMAALDTCGLDKQSRTQSSAFTVGDDATAEQALCFADAVESTPLREAITSEKAAPGSDGPLLGLVVRWSTDENGLLAINAQMYGLD